MGGMKGLLGDDLFSANNQYGKARLTDPETSHAAAESAGQFIGKHHADIIAVLRASKRAMAAEEIADVLGGGWNSVAVARRWNELIDAGLVIRTEERHTNRSGRSAFRHALRDKPNQ